MLSINQLGEKIANLLGDKETYGVKPVREFREFLKLTDHAPFEQLLPYQTYDDTRELFLNDASVGFGLELVPLSGCGEEQINRLSSLLNEKLPTEGNLHIQLISGNKFGRQLDAYYESRKNFNDKISKLALNRMLYYKKAANESLSKFMPVFIRDYKLFIYYSEPIKEQVEMQFEDILHLRESWVTTLSSITACQNLNINSFMSVLSEILNPSSNIDWPSKEYNKFDRISEQLIKLDTSYEVSEDSIEIEANSGKYVIQNFNVDEYPSRTSLWQTSENIGKFFEPTLQHQCPIIINVHIKAQSAEDSRAKAQKEFVMNDKTAHSPMARLMPSLKEKHNEWTMLRQNLTSNERLVKVSYQVTLISSQENYRKDAAKFADIMSNNEWRLSVDKYLQLPSFLQNLPFLMTSGLYKDLSYFKRFKTMTMFNAVNIMPLVTEWKGTSNSDGLMYIGRRGQLINWSNFGGNPKNYNIAIAAASGAGKSFVMQDIITNVLSDDGIVRIIDLGYSYKKLCDEIGGQYIDLVPGVCINPFTHVKDIKESLHLLRSIVSTMAHPAGGTTDKERQFITRAIMAAFSKYKNDTTITNVVDEIRTYDDAVANDLTILLESYIKGGQYEDFFEGKSSIRPNNPLVVLELNTLRDMHDLRAVAVCTVMQQINEEFYGLPLSVKKLCLLDEAWKLLSDNKQTSDMIGEGYRRIRKQRGAFVTIVQSLNDYNDTSIGRVITDNSSTKLILAHEPDALNNIKKNGTLELTPFEERAIRSFDVNNPHYKECLIKTGDGSCVVKIVVDPYSRVLYSTKGEEFEAVKKLIADGKTQEEAIDIVAKQVFGE